MLKFCCAATVLQQWDTMQTMAATKPLAYRFGVSLGQLAHPCTCSLVGHLPLQWLRVTVSIDTIAIATKLPPPSVLLSS